MRSIAVVSFALASLALNAQQNAAPAPLDPVKWSISATAQGKDLWDIVFTAKADPGWYVYSQQHFGDAGPMPTTFAFDTLPSFTLDGKTAEAGPHVKEGMDPIFEMKVKKFAGEARFTQRIRTSAPESPVTGRFDFMTCNDEACIFPDPVYFSIVPATGKSAMSGTPIKQADATNPPQEGLIDPVKWTVTASDLGGGKWRVDLKAAMEEAWSVYSQESFGEGPIPTVIRFDSAGTAVPLGKTAENGPYMHEGMDELFGIRVRKYGKEVTFSRELQVADPMEPINGTIEYMACDNARCIFPDPLPFSIIPATGASVVGGQNGPAPGGAGCDLKLAKVNLDAPVLRGNTETIDTQVRKGGSLWKIFLLGFAGGLLALLTPCVFPMIPLTVSFFTKGSEDKAKGMRNAITYGAFILAIYLLFSIPFHLLGSVNPEIFNEISTNPWLNIFFFVIFLVFAVSFFGYFEITLPASWVNKMDSNASRFGGAIGIFFMALTLALVSFSCTGPILGSLLAGALTGDGGAWQLTVGMGAFGLALALPFALFAMFPGWLNSLPKSGSWLNSVKVVLGFAEVALAFKFLSNADLVKGWQIVPYELFMAVWVLCALGVTLYMLGKLRFPHDSPLRKISPLRWGFAAAFLAFTVYLALGFRVDKTNNTFTTLKLMSGLAPPVGYSWIMPKECPSGFDCYHDLDAGLAQAKATGKPVLLDFTGYACVNCRKMEEHVWPVKGVHGQIDKEYVLISLYVDDKTPLPAEEQRDYTTCAGKQKRLQTVGNKWSTLQTETFINNSQPYYALLSPEGVLLTDPVGYTPDAQEYGAFLQRGLEAMKRLEAKASK
ncbi:MAG: thioredoxin family protein [Flavobacteriales bacterium]|nr:thioredoxin family protein [Flavobacteriales bacterium]